MGIVTPVRASILATALGAASILSKSLAPINGDHSWRQADAYAQILGMMGRRGLGPLSTFDGPPAMFDVPLYQALVAGLALVTGAEPLVVVRFVDAGLWAVLVWAAYRVSEQLRRGSGAIAVALLATSPLFLHYYAAPLPDTLALSLGTWMLAEVLEGRAWWRPAVLVLISSLVKSPIPFVLLVFLAVWLLLTKSWQHRRGYLAGLYGTALVAAVAAEGLRRWITPPTASDAIAFSPRWYFGHLTDRLAAWFWETMGFRVVEAFATPWVAGLILLTVAAALILRRSDTWRAVAACLAGFLSGWLIFTNVYVIHNYYGLPTNLLVMLAAAAAVASFVDVARGWVPTALVLVVALLIVYGHQLSDIRMTSWSDAARWALSESPSFVLVTDADTGPTVGGLVETPMSVMSPADFEATCEAVLAREPAVIADGPSPCLAAHRSEARVFLSGDGRTVWVR